MQIVVTGSLGHISKPLTKELVEKGHAVTVISRDPERKREIEALGAKAAIGAIEDVHFLTASFAGVDAVYCMIPPGGFFDHNHDLMAHVSEVTNKYAQAIQQAGVKRVIHLSSIGAHTEKNNGILRFHYNAEQIFKALPSDIIVKTVRPVAFYYNLLGFIPTIKNAGYIASNYGGEDVIAWVSPYDIAGVVAEELTTLFEERRIRYIASQELTCNEIAQVLGAAIGKPDLKWNVIPNEQMESILLGVGMNPRIAKGLVEMQDSMHSGELFEDYYRNKPVLSKVKITDFAKDFAVAFNQ
jgi:uncharacterized protein YbjT (DUF2867 family)